MTPKRKRSQVGLEHLQLAHKIAELNKAYGAIPRVKRQSELQAELDASPRDDATGG